MAEQFDRDLDEPESAADGCRTPLSAAPVINSIVEQLAPLYCPDDRDAPEGIGPALPHRRRVVEAFEQLLELLLPAGVSPEATQGGMFPMFLHERLSRAFRLLTVEIARALPLRWRGAYAGHEIECGHRPAVVIEPEQLMTEATRIVTAFCRRLPAVRDMLIDDVRAAYNGDPAALTYADVQLTYPAPLAMAAHRVAHELYLLNVPVVPRIISEHMHAQLGIDINPGAEIGRGFFMDHATGIVIGETALVGDNVKLYQGVTLGARSFPLDDAGFPQKCIKRHPTVEDDVIIYANATILGPVTIGKGSEIGGNVFLVHDVPAGSHVRQKLEVEVRPPRDAVN